MPALICELLPCQLKAILQNFSEVLFVFFSLTEASDISENTK